MDIWDIIGGLVFALIYVVLPVIFVYYVVRLIAAIIRKLEK